MATTLGDGNVTASGVVRGDTVRAASLAKFEIGTTSKTSDLSQELAAKITAPTEVGTDGQFLKKTEDGTEWADVTSGPTTYLKSIAADTNQVIVTKQDDTPFNITAQSVGAVSTSTTTKQFISSDICIGANYLTFTANEDDSKISFKWYSGSDVMYRLNGGDWQTYTAGTELELMCDDVVQFKGLNVVTNTNNHFTMSGSFAASGSVTSLIDGIGLDPYVTLPPKCCSEMFKECSALRSPPELPAENLSEQCYSYMFYNCYGLMTVPELPAMNLAKACYSNMFRECSSITSPPALPATELEEKCYAYMFYLCAQLASAPYLPAQSLGLYSYQSMFGGCMMLSYVKTRQDNFGGINCKDWLPSNSGVFHCTSTLKTFLDGLEESERSSSNVPTTWSVVADVE